MAMRYYAASPTPPPAGLADGQDAATDQAEWGLLVYFCAGEDLNGPALQAFDRMDKVFSPNHGVQVAVSLPGVQRVRRRVLHERARSWANAAGTADPDSIWDFVTWAREQVNAKKYALVLSGHGDIWQPPPAGGPVPGLVKIDHLRWLTDTAPRDTVRLDDARAVAPSGMGGLADSSTTHVLAPITLDTLGAKEILSRWCDTYEKPVDVFGLDACEMSTIELVWELQSLAGYLVASEVGVPLMGFEYGSVLQTLLARPQDDPKALAEKMADMYVGAAEKEDAEVSASVVCLAEAHPELTTLLQSLGDLGTALTGQLPEHAGTLEDLFTDASEDDDVDDDLLIDLHQLCRSLTGDLRNGLGPEVHEAATAVGKALPDAVVYNPGAGAAPAGGLSAFIPLDGEVSERYSELKIAKSPWGEFVKKWARR